MNELTLTGLLNAAKSEFAKNKAQWLIIEVEVGESKPEIIINPKANFQSKIDYYSKAYNEDLTLKAIEEVKIINYTFVEKLEDILC